ncbi:hypothetical protein OIDMADRAFT_19230 [Oidiodendron maius Zn]|uniref:Uncharacterized protein n=1 Tax=Oidiodendron maius (strain Zn) TaxID=913774 RepID=A0A0C3CQN8_OIDMZ|nr:hypothetical protein OIDMADRAFT_19230 [Oidiodendron maius Zn]
MGGVFVCHRDLCSEFGYSTPFVPSLSPALPAIVLESSSPSSTKGVARAAGSSCPFQSPPYILENQGNAVGAGAAPPENRTFFQKRKYA